MAADTSDHHAANPPPTAGKHPIAMAVQEKADKQNPPPDSQNMPHGQARKQKAIHHRIRIPFAQTQGTKDNLRNATQRSSVTQDVKQSSGDVACG